MRQLLQIRATVITNWGKLYYKLGQLLQIGAIITNWGITIMIRMLTRLKRSIGTFNNFVKILGVGPSPKHR